MKLLVDVAKLEAEGTVTPEQATEIRRVASAETASLAINSLSAIGIIAVVGGVIALAPGTLVTAVLGFALAAAGLGLGRWRPASFGFLAGVLVLIGALLHCGAILIETKGSIYAFAYAVAIFAGAGIALKHGLLCALGVFALAALLGSSTGYWHGAYALWVKEATITIVVFGMLAALAFAVAARAPAAYARLARIVGLLSIVWINFGFWVGSLFGDRPGFSWIRAELLYADPPVANRWGLLREAREQAFFIPADVYAGIWAVSLIAAGVWAATRNQRGVVNAVVTFASIHLYTQWFERLRATPEMVIAGGAVAVGIAFALWRYNHKAREKAQAE